jgi:tRNA(Arg) A34 adenosine deaminase TadA
MKAEEYMRKAIEQALKAPEFPFGAIIVRRATGVIVSEGYNQSSLNPTFHGEMVAINRCAELYGSSDWSEFDLYTTAEPCPMCQSAVEWAGIATIYYGTSMTFLQQQQWRQITIRAEEVIAQTAFRSTRIIGGILEAECNALFEHAPRGRYHTNANSST